MQKGFTLIEVLVIIAIIGILSSVVLTSLSTARAKSRIACAATGTISKCAEKARMTDKEFRDQLIEDKEKNPDFTYLAERQEEKPTEKTTNCDDYKTWAMKDVPAMCIKHFSN